MAGALEGRTALVTGASGGIGAAAATRLAQMGAVVVVHGRDAQRTAIAAERVRAAGGTAHAVIGSLSSSADADTVVEAVRAVVNCVDILVNNAGGDSAQDGMASFFDVPADEWVATYDSNVGSMVRMTHAFISGMRDKEWGRVILLSSAVVDEPMAQIPDYQGAKSAIRSMARSMSKALARTGITVNSVSPGFILTDKNSLWVRRMAEKAGIEATDWQAIEAWAAKRLVPTPAGRLGKPEDVANAIAFLADPASDFVNGIDLSVRGGS